MSAASRDSDASDRDVMQYEVVIVGAGPAGLACAIRLKQLKPALQVCVLEKAAAVGAHALSGCVLEPGPLEQLLPGWRDAYPGMKVPATEDDFRIFTPRGSFKPAPDWLVRLLPRSMTYSTPFNNHGNYLISLGQLTAWLASRAEALGVEVFAGFAAAAPLFDERGAVRGVRIGDMGRGKDGTPGANFTPGVDIHAPLTVLAEGARGSIAKQLIARFDLGRGHCPQTFALGYKELWQLPAGRVRPGRIEHGLGWPADAHTYAGSFLYHLDNDRVYVGYIVGLDYQDPRLAPFEAFQQYKNHPSVKALLAGGEIVSAGARTIAAGGWQSTPTLEMPGAILVGDAGGTLNFAKIKGVHQALRSGTLAAEHVAGSGGGAGFDARWRTSVGGQELQARAQLQARLQAWPVGRTAERGLGDAHRRQVAVDAGQQRRLVASEEARGIPLARAALGGAHAAAARSRVVRVLRRQCPRGEPAGASEGGRHLDLRAALRQRIRPSLRALLPGRGVRDGRRRQRRTAPADQRRQLRALQGLRHQGPVRHHHLDDARGRLGTELPVAVAS